MSNFPQMPKRSVELPLGCKDILDVEEVRQWKPVFHQDWPGLTSDRLAYIEGQLVQRLQAAGKSKLVGIACSQDRGQIIVTSNADLAAPIIFASWHSAAEEQALRGVFEEAGISPATGPLGRWKAKDLLKYALPVEASRVARLVGEVFRAGYGLGDLSLINLWYHERKLP